VENDTRRVYTMKEAKERALRELEYIENWAKTKREIVSDLLDNEPGWLYTQIMFSDIRQIQWHFNAYIALCHDAVESERKS